MTAPLPEGVRRRVVEFAADRLGVLEPDQVPPSLRPFAKFAPGRRRQVALPIAAALETDDDFRSVVADGLRESTPELVTALESGAALPAADPYDVAAAAYLLRTPGWAQRVAVAADVETAERDVATQRSVQRDADRRDREIETELAGLRTRLDDAETRAARAVDDIERERRRARDAADRARRAEAALAEMTAARVQEVERAQAAAELAEAELRRSRQQLAEAQDALERARRDTRETREAADIRRWLLLDTLSRSLAGLREELAPAPPVRRPADLVTAGEPAAADAPTLDADDPAAVDLLLSLPNAHLVVDGYNVTKTGYPDLTLEDQRSRLVAGLAALAARTGAEVTCVFDGAEVQVRVPATALRRVRVRFSPAGQTADELIRRLVRAEPTGRPVTVVSSDREVVDGVRRAGARTLSSRALLARLDRA